jgi:hypothetical protein
MFQQDIELRQVIWFRLPVAALADGAILAVGVLLFHSPPLAPPAGVKVLNLAGIVVPALYGFQGAEAERDGSCGSLLNGYCPD